MKTLVAGVLAVGLAAAPTPTPDGLSQSLDPNQREAAGRAVLQSGHVDIGPRYRGGAWTVQVHDGTATPPVWRKPDDVVLRVRDTAVLEVPDDPAYAFLGQRPGSPVHVVPQTQNPDVVWLGWNTQDPAVVEAVPRGVTMNLLGVHGPGSLVVYLQSGNLGAPQVLWNSTLPYPQPLWVDTNTHTHANWVFTQPGVYLLAMELTAESGTGPPLAGRATFRLAVGDRTGDEEAFAARYPDDDLTTPAASASPAAAAPDADAGGGSNGLWAAAIGAAAVALAVVVALVAAFGVRARRRAAMEHAP